MRESLLFPSPNSKVFRESFIEYVGVKVVHYLQVLCFSAICSRPSYSSIVYSTSSGISTISKLPQRPLASSQSSSITWIRRGSSLFSILPVFIVIFSARSFAVVYLPSASVVHKS